MPQVRTAFLFLLIGLAAILLMVMGAEGSLGRMLCVVLAPGRLAIRDNAFANAFVQNYAAS